MSFANEYLMCEIGDAMSLNYDNLVVKSVTFDEKSQEYFVTFEVTYHYGMTHEICSHDEDIDGLIEIVKVNSVTRTAVTSLESFIRFVKCLLNPKSAWSHHWELHAKAGTDLREYCTKDRKELKSSLENFTSAGGHKLPSHLANDIAEKDLCHMLIVYMMRTRRTSSYVNLDTSQSTERVSKILTKLGGSLFSEDLSVIAKAMKLALSSNYDPFFVMVMILDKFEGLPDRT